MATDWAHLRAEFPALAPHHHRTYLNTATYGQTPRAATAAIMAHLAHRDELACSDFLSWFNDADRLRGSIGRLIGCSGDDIAYLPTAAAALSLMIGGIDWRAGDRVVTLDYEFPNNLYYPALLGGRGVEFVEAPWGRFLEEATHPRTRLVAISSVSYITGFRAPLAAIAAELERRGTIFYVDGTQSVGALRMDVGEFRPAMMCVDAYKWMLTPNGAGFVYVDPKAREWLQPAVVGWRSHHDWRSVDNLHTGAPAFSAAAEKYEGGMIPFGLLAGLEKVVDLMLEIGPETIEARVLALAADLRHRLARFGATVVHDNSQIVAARFPAGWPEASTLARRLRERGVMVSARHGHVRISVHFYNDEGDLDRLRAALEGMAP